MQATSIVTSLLPGFPSSAATLAAHVLGISRLESIYGTLRNHDSSSPLPERLLEHLRIAYELPNADWNHIPTTGPVIIVANHPFGLLDGAILAHVARRVRSDVRILANGILRQIPELKDLIIPLHTASQAKGEHFLQLRQALRHLIGGGLLIVFPAGEVSHYQRPSGEITDPAWTNCAVRLARLAAGQQNAPVIVPVFLSGRNSILFQAAGLIHPMLRTALLPRELLNKEAKSIRVRVGSPIALSRLSRQGDDDEQTAYIRWRTYLLPRRDRCKPMVGSPLRSRRNGTAQVPVIAPTPANAMTTEIAALTPAALLANSGDLDVYIATANHIPSVLREISRLREITFRSAGEGTGKSADLDHFDAHYLHLFLWNRQRQEIAGAYRLYPTDGVGSLYTANLFGYRQSFRDRLGPAIELGRSFVRSEYQRAFTPLLLLWKGIGRYVAANPRYKVLFGPVSISNQYHAISRELIVSYLQAHASLSGWKDLLSPRYPPGQCTSGGARCRDVDELSEVISDIENTSNGIPVLLRQYLRLGGKLLAFNVDPEFSNALDGLIVVDLTCTEAKLLDRYLGTAEARTFLSHHGA